MIFTDKAFRFCILFLGAAILVNLIFISQKLTAALSDRDMTLNEGGTVVIGSSRVAKSDSKWRPDREIIREIPIVDALELNSREKGSGVQTPLSSRGSSADMTEISPDPALISQNISAKKGEIGEFILVEENGTRLRRSNENSEELNIGEFVPVE